MPSTSSTGLRALLSAAGYEIRFRTSGWTECLVLRERERWPGRGESEDAALDDALGRMLPSHVARELLARQLQVAPPPAVTSAPEHAAAPPEGALAAPPPPAAKPALPVALAAAEATTAAPPVALAAAEATTTAPSLAAAEATTAAPPVALAAAVATTAAPALAAAEATTAAPPVALAAAEATTTAPAVALAPAEATTAEPAPPVALAPGEPAATPPAAEPALPVEAAASPAAEPALPIAAAAEARGPTADEALVALDGILQGIEQQLGTFGRLAPARQRAFLLIWICRARSYEDALPHEREVHRRIGIIARRLAELAKTFWPGSVRALQLTARPWDVPELRVRGASAPRNWVEASARADGALEDQLAEAERTGLDADGWMDDHSVTAPVGDPAQVLATVVAAVDGALGPRGLDQPESLDGAAIEALAVAAKRLRRLRRFVDGVAWGLAMGRLRRAAPALGARGARVRDAIDPTRRA
jgi:hypothetical protein